MTQWLEITWFNVPAGKNERQDCQSAKEDVHINPISQPVVGMINVGRRPPLKPYFYNQTESALVRPSFGPRSMTDEGNC